MFQTPKPTGLFRSRADVERDSSVGIPAILSDEEDEAKKKEREAKKKEREASNKRVTL